VALRFNPPPGWPVPPGFAPPQGWQPDPSWPPVPPEWPLWIADDAPSGYGLPTAPPVAPYQAYSYGGPPQQTGTTNGMAITSFILGLIGVTLLSIIFGIIGLVQIRRRGQRGKGFAIAGLVLSGLWIVILVAVALGGGISVNAHVGTGGTSSGPITSTKKVNIFSLTVGDCFQNPPASQSVLGVTEVTATPCTVAHNAQVFAQFNATNASYPGASALITEAKAGCQTRTSALDRSQLTKTMTLHFLYPEKGSWAEGRRSITCLVVDSTKDLTSSLLAG
jgi:Domain of unknown function (DUF4190)/Septum formation